MGQLDAQHGSTSRTGGPRRRPAAAGGAFTIVELLIVIAVIIILLSILVLSLSLARKTGQSANTQTLMSSLRQGLVRFKGDMGYLPPILDDQRRLREPPIPGSSGYATAIQDWYSMTSLAEYLIGYGHHGQDGYGFVPPSAGGPLHEDEQPPIGIRRPGPDGVWGAGPDTPIERRDPVGEGRVFGPYIELARERLLGGLLRNEDGTFAVVLPGERFYTEELPKVILDYWGQPIFYYRRNYPPGALAQSYRPVDTNGDGVPEPVPTLSDFIRLRPYHIEPEEATNAAIPDQSAASDPTTSFTLETGEFALYSRGADRTDTPLVRVDDPDAFNQDNLVEIGP